MRIFWDIEAVCKEGVLKLEKGGGVLLIDGIEQPGAIGQLDGEYPQLYADMAALVPNGASEVDLRPMLHVSDALTLGKRQQVSAFEW